MPTRADALAILHEHTKSDQLRKHGLAVEAAMRAFARRYGEDEELWGIVGLLHDFDYEANPEQHPYVGAQILRDLGWPEVIVEGVLAHAPFTGTLRDTPLKKTIFAVDELTGFVTACALVYGRDLGNVTPDRVKKKLKDKAFARGVVREDIYTSFEEMFGETGEDPAEHIQFVINSLRPVAADLGLAG
ncbi:MAG: HDIG domain-containing protein [Chloroflexota bacterium]